MTDKPEVIGRPSDYYRQTRFSNVILASHEVWVVTPNGSPPDNRHIFKKLYFPLPFRGKLF